MKRFKGFTLTELMVSMAVIGILVAVVTPAIMKTRPNQNKMMIKKSFYTVQQVVSSLINDENIYPDMSDNCPHSSHLDDTCAWGFDYTDGKSFEGTTYSGVYKFAALFKSKLNVKRDSGTAVESSDRPVSGEDFSQKFYTTDGIFWDLSHTKGAWTSNKDKVGSFAQCTTADSNSAGCGYIIINVDTSSNNDGHFVYCTDENGYDCNSYRVQILANGKLRIDPSDTKAIDFVTIQTSIKDSVGN